MGLGFECVYTGFLSSQEQIDHCLKFFSTYQDALAVVDPVMGDHGRPYRTITPQMRSRLGELVRVADIITPNLTEACMLLKIPYFNEGLSRAQAKSLLVRLSELGPNYVVITGAPMASGSIANIGYDRQNNSFWYIDCDYVPVSYPGTGDLFASVLTGGFLTGDSLPMAMGRAAYFVERCIKTTFSYSSDTRYGVMLEKELGVETYMNRDFSLSFSRGGARRRDGHLSAGIRTVCALCLRLALSDEMFAGRETPFLLLDDPFVHLDEAHFEKTARLLRELSKDRQIVYFTCHRSRSVLP